MEPDDYFQKVRLEAGQFMMSKLRIYLDTKFWIFMRQAEQGKATTERQEIYKMLSCLVKDGQAICALSGHTFLELFKQADQQSRLSTADVIDKLSQQYCFVSLTQIVGQELITFIRNAQAKPKQLPPHENVKYVWTRVPFILGELFPTWDHDSDSQEQIREKFLEYYSKMSLKDIVERIPSGLLVKSRSDLIDRLNKGKDENQSWKTYREVFMHEVAGVLDVLRNDFEQIWMHLFEVDYGETVPKEVIQRLKGVDMLTNLIYQAFNRGKIARELPFINIRATIHAQYRYDKARKFKENDLEDIGHTAWALPYCQYFFTEDNFAAIITQTKMDSYYNTTVLSKENEIVEMLSKLI